MTEIGPYKVPEGIVVWPMIYALQNSLHNWDDPEDFNPVRTVLPVYRGHSWGGGKTRQEYCRHTGFSGWCLSGRSKSACL